MHFNKHSHLDGRHAFLAPSKPAWLGYEEDKVERTFLKSQAAARGDALHSFAAQAINLGVKMGETKTTMNLYVNDCIGFRMSAEQSLFYSDNCFGKADAIGFRNNTLRISDLKTGITATSHHQLEIYAALFCLEYRHRPFDIKMELRIYQSNEVREFFPDPDDIMHVMDRIISFDKLITAIKMEA